MADNDKAKADDNRPKPDSASRQGDNTHVLLIVAAVVSVIFIFMLGVGVSDWRHNSRPAGYHSLTMMGGLGGTRMGGQRFGGSGYAGGINTSNQVSGTVTAVNGSSFTLAGYGSSSTVQTDSSTQYQGGNSVKVNDTVSAFGSSSNGTLTATLVRINP